MEKRKVLLKDSTDEIFDWLVTEPERSEASEEHSEDELTAEQNQEEEEQLEVVEEQAEPVEHSEAPTDAERSAQAFRPSTLCNMFTLR